MQTAASTVVVIEPARPMIDAISNRIAKDSGLDVAASFANVLQAAKAGVSFEPASLIDRFVTARNTTHKAGSPFGLIARERKGLDAGVCGLTAIRVSAHLNISARMVEAIRNGIRKKTACQSIAEVSHLMQADGVAGESSGQMAQFMETENT